MFTAAAPILFVLIWSTGFIVARAVIPHCSPELFITIRLLLVAALLGGAALVAREQWPRGRKLGLHLLSGAMLPGFYLMAGWWSVQHGMPAGIMSLLGALTPLPVAFLSFFLRGERLAIRSWAGLAIGVTGVAMVLAPAIGHGVGSLDLLTSAVAIVAVFGVAGATMIQHTWLAADPLRTSGAVQNAGGTLVALVALLLIGGTHWDNGLVLWLGLAWAVLGLSAAALSLLTWMLRHQGATRVSTLFLLTPPLAAIEAWALLGERLGPIQIAGFVAALGGVLLARSRPPAAINEPA